MVFRYLSRLEIIRQQSMRCLRRTRVWLCLVAALLWSLIFQVKGDWDNNGALHVYIPHPKICRKLCLDLLIFEIACSFACARQFFIMPSVAEDNLPRGRRHRVLHKKTLQLLDFMDIHNLPENAQNFYKDFKDYCNVYYR